MGQTTKPRRRTTRDRKQEALLQTLDIIEAIQDTLVDVPARRLYLSQEVDDSVVRKLLAGLHRLDDLSNEEITLLINSPGGCPYDAMALFDAMTFSRSPITAIGSGQVMSAATIIMQAAHKRCLTPNTRFMIHKGNWSLGDVHASVVVAIGKEEVALSRMYAEILANKSKHLTAEEVEELMAKETFLSSEEALRYGFVDAILTPGGPVVRKDVYKDEDEE